MNRIQPDKSALIWGIIGVTIICLIVLLFAMGVFYLALSVTFWTFDWHNRYILIDNGVLLRFTVITIISYFFYSKE